MGVLLAVVALSSFSTISTASAGGATVTHENFNFNECVPYEFSWPTGWTQGESCFDTRGVLQNVTTPSGNVQSVWIERGTFSSWTIGEDWSGAYYQWDTSDTAQSEFRNISHFKNGLPQVYSWTIKDTAIITDNLTGLTISCTFENIYHYANGIVTKDTFVAGCEPTP